MPRRRRRPCGVRAPGDRAAPAAVALERAPAAGDAGVDRWPLRRRRARSATEALAAGQRAEEPVAAQFHATQIGAPAPPAAPARGRGRARRARRRASRTSPSASRRSRRGAARSPPPTPSSATQPRRERCSSRSPPTDFADVPLDAQWSISLTLLAEAATFLGDAPRARALYDAARCRTTGPTVIAGRAAACYGPVVARARPARGDRRPPRRRRAPLRRRAGAERAHGRPAVRRADPVRARPAAARPRRRRRSRAGARPARVGARGGPGDRHGRARPARRSAARLEAQGLGVARRQHLDRLHDRRGGRPSARTSPPTPRPTAR